LEWSLELRAGLPALTILLKTDPEYEAFTDAVVIG
jgi:hypothetical protein